MKDYEQKYGLAIVVSAILTYHSGFVGFAAWFELIGISAILLLLECAAQNKSKEV